MLSKDMDIWEILHFESIKTENPLKYHFACSETKQCFNRKKLYLKEIFFSVCQPLGPKIIGRIISVHLLAQKIADHFYVTLVRSV